MAPEVGYWNVPLAQKVLVRKCTEAGKLSILATQMLLSMVDSPSPSRAELMDVFNGVLDGYDCTLTSDETTVGKNPAGAVEAMARLAWQAEGLLPGPELKRKADVALDLRRLADAAMARCPPKGPGEASFQAPATVGAEAIRPPERPQVYVLISGKRTAGKDYVAEKISQSWAKMRAMRNRGHCAVFQLADVVKRKFTQVKGLDAAKLSSQDAADRAYKEEHRQALTEFFSLYLQQFDSAQERVNHICSGVVQSVRDSGGDQNGTEGIACVCVSDVRAPAEMAWFEEKDPPHVSNVFRVRVEASDETRARHGWTYEAGKDDDPTETGLDAYSNWDMVFNNDEDGELAIKQWVMNELLPRIVLFF